MASPSLLDFDALLAPLPGEHPAGVPLPFSVRAKLDELRKEIDPNLFDADDPLRPEAPKRADWPGIVRTAQETLTKTSKDLLVAARLTEALLKQHGFAGLRDGVQLQRRLLAECWDRLFPDLDDGDLEVRAAPFNWLDDADRGARFPTAVRLTTLLTLEARHISWQDWRRMQDGVKGALKPEVFEQAVTAATYETAKLLADDLEGCALELQQLAQALTDKLGAAAPAMLSLQKAVADCLGLVQHVLKKKVPPPAPVVEEPAAAATADAPAGTVVAPAPARKVTTREDVYRQLTEAANLLQRLEPHSPIPYLIQKAIELGALPFPKLMRALIRDDNVLVEMNRELGIKEAEPPAE